MTKNRIGHENPAFKLDQQPYIINTTNGSILKTKLQSTKEEDDDDDEEDKNNVGFEKLPKDGHSYGLFVLKFRKYIVQITEKQKNCSNLWIEINLFNWFSYFLWIFYE
ncbi:unnamed protein product [Adineta steineri]|uniref:Uncharacterized protein n=1 Tax=Adineta steineri TaxID=433720 RepID=A0A815SI15_9BILA|nr:unnamed protein product [Adineta steineri]CAF1641792.1 unnamed protein product [Adineta steineri]